MSHTFRELLKKIGSGPHTGQSLTRTEAASATRMMLLQEATPAQIGAFMIAQRIKRPTGEELAGMLDAYEELGPQIPAINSKYPVMVLNAPYDGRDRTLPLSLVTTLVLAAAGCPVLQHGGDRMPTKEGTPLVEFWQGLGIDWTRLSLQQIHQVLQSTGIGFVYLPNHFALAQGLVPFREQIGKRPPFATLELLWCPYAGDANVVVGFVHPPTENMARTAFALRGTTRFTTVKGLEGSCDLPRERTAIIGLSAELEVTPISEILVQDASEILAQDAGVSPAQPPANSQDELPVSLPPLTRLHLHSQDYGFGGKNVPFQETLPTVELMHSVLQGEVNELRKSVLWNSGFYLWRSGICADLQEAIAMAATLIDRGQAWQKLKELEQATASHPLLV